MYKCCTYVNFSFWLEVWGTERAKGGHNFKLRFPLQSPVVSYENRHLLHLPLWVTTPASTCLTLSNGCSAQASTLSALSSTIRPTCLARLSWLKQRYHVPLIFLTEVFLDNGRPCEIGGLELCKLKESNPWECQERRKAQFGGSHLSGADDKCIPPHLCLLSQPHGVV